MVKAVYGARILSCKIRFRYKELWHSRCEACSYLVPNASVTNESKALLFHYFGLRSRGRYTEVEAIECRVLQKCYHEFPL